MYERVVSVSTLIVRQELVDKERRLPLTTRCKIRRFRGRYPRPTQPPLPPDGATGTKALILGRRGGIGNVEY